MRLDVPPIRWARRASVVDHQAATADAAVRRNPRPKAVVPMPVELIPEEPVDLRPETERYLKTVANKRAYEVKKAARLARQAASRQAQALA